MRRCEHLLWTSNAFATLVVVAAAAATAPQPKAIVLMMSDDTGWGDMGYNTVSAALLARLKRNSSAGRRSGAPPSRHPRAGCLVQRELCDSVRPLLRRLALLFFDNSAHNT